MSHSRYPRNQKSFIDYTKLKIPREDGMNAIFFKKHQDVIRNDIIEFVQELFKTCYLNSDIDKTLIIFPHKKKILLNITYYMPISLSNVTYKIITKILIMKMR